MSGKDEKPERDIPICVRCNLRPEFWILESVLEAHSPDGWFWLNSDKEMVRGACGKLVYVPPRERPNFTLDDIIVVTCRPEAVTGTIEGKKHSFYMGDPIFNKVLQQARRCKIEWER